MNKSIYKIVLYIFILSTVCLSQTEQKNTGIAKQRVNLFNNTNFNKKIIHSISKGDTLKIFEDSDRKYFRVYYKKNEIKKWGWVDKKNVKLIGLTVASNELITDSKVEEIIKNDNKNELRKIIKSKDSKINLLRNELDDIKLKNIQSENKLIEKSDSLLKAQEKNMLILNELNKEKMNSNGRNNPPLNSKILSNYYFLYFLIVLLTSILSKVVYDLFLINRRFKPVVNLDKEVLKVEKQLKKLSGSYKSKKNIYDKILKQIELFEDELEMSNFGLYKPHFSFEDSDEYKAKILSLREDQKQMIRDYDAIPPDYNWTVDGSKAKGKADINRRIRVCLRAFNGECDAIIAKARWNNIDILKNRIKKSEEALNKFLIPSGMYFNDDFVQLKIDQLYAAYEYKERKHQEKEERRLILKAEREEKKVLAEAANLQKEAEKKEKLYNKALEDAKKELGLLSGKDLESQNQKILELESKLEEALSDKQRAISRAQLTKSGHVYVISNIGSFGKEIFKIGLTRRLEPEIRVKELGDASVPFGFDTHAMIYSDDAPALEKKLHKMFDSKRVNLANSRKEYFNTSLEEIKEAVLSIDKSVDFISTTESREYKETKNILNKMNKKIQDTKLADNNFPENI